MPMPADVLERGRERLGFTVGQVAYRVGVTPAEYRDLLAGRRSWTCETWDKISNLFGIPRSFAGR
jgi:plasmid maintenance system antidote protein VapI